jgi:hypothetical protein
MHKYLLYDSGCTTCSHLADVVHEAVGDSLALLSLRTPEAKGLLDEAFPKGWRYAPYVVTVDGNRVHARTGLQATMQLGLWMGPVNALRVWQTVTQEFAPKRRHFLKGTLTSIFILLLMRSQITKTVYAGECYCGIARCLVLFSPLRCVCGTCGCWARDQIIVYKPLGYSVYGSCCSRANCSLLTHRWTCQCSGM